MRAVVLQEFGEPEALSLQEIPAPHPGAQQVSIRVAYVGVNYADILSRRNRYHDVTLPFVLGVEVSGYIDEIGEGVEGFYAGQAVCAFTLRGGYAEIVIASAAMTFPLENAYGSLDLATAAAFLSVLPTAYDMLMYSAHLQAGETILIHGAAGGVGSVAGQLARYLMQYPEVDRRKRKNLMQLPMPSDTDNSTRAMPNTSSDFAPAAGLVLGTVGSEQKIAHAKSSGYDHVFLRANFMDSVRAVTAGRGVDVVLDPSGEPTRSQNLDLLAPFGRLVIFGYASGNPDIPFAPLGLITGNKAVIGYSITSLHKTNPEHTAATIRRVMELLVEGHIQIAITDILPLEQAAIAHRRMESNTTTGKVLLQVS